MAGSTTDRRGLYILALGLCVATAAHYASMDFLGPLLADDGELSPQYETILRVIIACLAILAAFAALGWFNLGLWHELRGNTADARRYYERAIEANPQYVPAYEKLGRRPPV